MRTVKEVATLTGISVRTLQYYDEIGVFKPTRVTEAGYRLYDDEALKTLQQILFFKELDFPLKDIKTIMEDPEFDKIKAFKEQKKLLKARRDRLNRLLDLLEKLEKGETCMSFKEFDLSGYIQALEQLKSEHTDEVIRQFGSLEAFDEFVERAKDHEDSIAQNAVKYYGSVEKYVESMKESLAHFSENTEKMRQIKENGYVEKNNELIKKMLQDLTKDPKSPEIQAILKEQIELLPAQYRPVMDPGENYYKILADEYLTNPAIQTHFDKLHGPGAARFMGEAIQYYNTKK